MIDQHSPRQARSGLENERIRRKRHKPNARIVPAANCGIKITL